jgi:hypothetical protein
LQAVRNRRRKAAQQCRFLEPLLSNAEAAERNADAAERGRSELGGGDTRGAAIRK